jgi:hypothetical protein
VLAREPWESGAVTGRLEGLLDSPPTVDGPEAAGRAVSTPASPGGLWQRIVEVRQRIVGDRPRLAVVALALLLLVVNALWIWVHRHGGDVNIDEAGYLSISLTDYHEWQVGGLPGVIGMAIHQQVQPPLVPLLSSLTYVLFGRPSVMAAFGVELLAYIAIMLLTYGIARDLAGKAGAVAAAIAVAAAPIMLDYAHVYLFALPAAAFSTAAVWAALRSHQMSSFRWSVVWGGALGAMLVSRTMTIAFVPAFILLALIHVAVSRDRLRSTGGLACGTVAAAAVAGPWWIMSGSSAWAYLTSFGYGVQSPGYGASRTLLSWSSWVSFVGENLNGYIWLPLGLVLIFGVAALVFKLVSSLTRPRRVRARHLLGSGWFYLVVVVGEGLFALESSRNSGSGFLAPIVPAMFALAVAALVSASSGRRRVAIMAVAVVIVASTPSLVAKIALDNPTGQPVEVTVPVLGAVVVVDARSSFDIYEMSGGELDPQDASAAKWRTANVALADLVDAFSSREVGPTGVIFAFNGYLINVNSYWLQELEDHGVSPPLDLLAPPSGPTSTYTLQIQRFLGSEHGVLLISPDRSGMFPPDVYPAAVVMAATGLGFVRDGSVSLPDHSVVDIWVR